MQKKITHPGFFLLNNNIANPKKKNASLAKTKKNLDVAKKK